MRISAISIPLLVALALPANRLAQPAMPLMHSVQPDSGKAGDVLAIEGENLGQQSVAAVYLTNGSVDIKVEIVNQTATAIRFRIPAEAKPGRFALMVLTKEDPPELVQQPVKIWVELPTTSSAIQPPW